MSNQSEPWFNPWTIFAQEAADLAQFLATHVIPMATPEEEAAFDEFEVMHGL